MGSSMKLFLAIPINLVLWNVHAWSRNESDLRLLDKFYHKVFRKILGIHMKHIMEECINNENIWKLFGGVKYLSHTWR